MQYQKRRKLWYSMEAVGSYACLLWSHIFLYSSQFTRQMDTLLLGNPRAAPTRPSASDALRPAILLRTLLGASTVRSYEGGAAPISWCRVMRRAWLARHVLQRRPPH